PLTLEANATRHTENAHQRWLFRYFTSAATLSDLILSGFCTGSPRLILSTFSMPSITLPHTVYCLSRKLASSKQMKNWLLALLGFWARAIEHTPRTCGSALNSAGRLPYFE